MEEMQRYIVSLKANTAQTPSDLAGAFTRYLPEARIVEGAGRSILTVEMSNEDRERAERVIQFADFEEDSDLDLLEI